MRKKKKTKKKKKKKKKTKKNKTKKKKKKKKKRKKVDWDRLRFREDFVPSQGRMKKTLGMKKRKKKAWNWKTVSPGLPGGWFKIDGQSPKSTGFTAPCGKKTRPAPGRHRFPPSSLGTTQAYGFTRSKVFGANLQRRCFFVNAQWGTKGPKKSPNGCSREKSFRSWGPFQFPGQLRQEVSDGRHINRYGIGKELWGKGEHLAQRRPHGVH